MLGINLGISLSGGQSSSFSPLLNPNLKLWLEPSSLVFNGSNEIGQWTDLSGQGNHLTQGTTANKPIFTAAGGPNGLDCALFDFSNDLLSRASAVVDPRGASGCTIYVVSKYTAAQGGRVLGVGGNNGGAGLTWSLGSTKRTIDYSFVGANTSGSTPNNWEIWTLVSAVGWASAAAGQPDFYVNGGSPQTLAGGTLLPAATQALTEVGNYAAGVGGTYFGGRISHVIMCSGRATTQERQQMEAYLSSKTGIAVT